MNISFKANLISTSSVPQYNNSQETPVSFVEFDCHDIEDMRAMNKIANNYSRIVTDQNKKRKEPNGANYHTDIRNHFNKAFISPNFHTNSSFFALTTQNDDFKYLDSQKVLGLLEIWNSDLSYYYEVKYLQVNPLHKNGEPTREYKNIGTKILDCIREYLPHKDIHLISDYNVVGFYKKYGFKVFRLNQMIFKCK